MADIGFPFLTEDPKSYAEESFADVWILVTLTDMISLKNAQKKFSSNPFSMPFEFTSAMIQNLYDSTNNERAARGADPAEPSKGTFKVNCKSSKITSFM